MRATEGRIVRLGSHSRHKRAVAARLGRQKAIAAYVGMNIQQLRADIKKLVVENVLAEGTGQRGRKIYRLPPEI